MPAMFFPFDLDGPSFLLLYAALWLVALAAYGLYLTARPEPVPTAPLRFLDPIRAAWLAGGARSAFAAALTGLLGRGLIEPRGAGFAPAPGTLQKQHVGRPLSAAESELLRLLPGGLESAWRGFAAAPLNLERELAEAGLWRPARGLREVAGPFAVAFAGLALLAVARGAQGLATGHPIGYLLLELLVGGGLALGLTQSAARPRPTAAGRRALAELRQRSRPTRRALRRLGAPEPGPDPALAVALFGTGVLIGGPLEAVHRAARPVLASDGGSACTTTGPTGYGDSGSSDGGSSCGGGGCGGCGGD